MATPQAAPEQRYTFERFPTGARLRDAQTGATYFARVNDDGSIETIDEATGQPSTGPFRARRATPDEIQRGVAEDIVFDQRAEDQEILQDNEDEMIFRMGTGGAVWRYDKKNDSLREHTLQEGIPTGVKRVAAGAISPFTDITGDEAGYFPAAPEQIVAFGGFLADMIPGVDIEGGSYVDRATQRVGEADASMRDFLGITPPENLGDVALETLGALIVPGPKAGRTGSGTTALSKIAGASQDAMNRSHAAILI